MKNIRVKVLVLALTSVSATVFADVNLYGKVAVGMENDQFQNNTIPGGGSIQDYGSYFGIRGTDPVYGETSVIWQVEQYLDIAGGQSYYSTTGGGMIVPNPNGGKVNVDYMNNNVNTLASSETYLGLQGGWGRLRMGNLSNYVRSNMGNTNMFNCANGVNCLGKLTRTSKLIPTSIRYDSPDLSGLNFSLLYGFNNNGMTDLSGISNSNNYGVGLNGVYSGGILVGGVGYTYGNWTANLGAMINQQVGNYSTGSSGLTSGVDPKNGQPYNPYQDATYSNAYAGTLELGYNDPDGLIANAALQVTNGWAWNSWANSGGTLGTIYSNPSFQSAAQLLATNSQLQTQEIGVSFGYHLGPWTPKIGYAYGNNLMYGANTMQLITGSGNQIADTGYNSVAAELDWNITPRTIAFVNYGQVWYGNTLQNVTFSDDNGSTIGQANSSTIKKTVINGNNQYQANQSTFAVGFSHTF